MGNRPRAEVSTLVAGMIWTNFRVCVALTVVGAAVGAVIGRAPAWGGSGFGRVAPALSADSATLALTAVVQSVLWIAVERRGDDAARVCAGMFGVIAACSIAVGLGRAAVGSPGPSTGLLLVAAYVATSNLLFAVAGRR